VNDFTVGILILLTVISAMSLIAITLLGHQRLRELAIKERIAMIERGLLPAPEADPARFERALLLAHAVRHGSSPKSARYRTLGVMLMGLGGALFLLIAFAAGAPEVAFGIAGGIFVLGIAAYINGSLIARDVAATEPLAPAPSAPPPLAPPPPDNVAS
jgi:CBS domain containing-hemolysin-like protein